MKHIWVKELSDIRKMQPTQIKSNIKVAEGASDWLVLGCSEHSLKWSRDIVYQIIENDCKWNSKLGTEKISASGNSGLSHPSFSGYTDYVAGFLTEPVFFMHPICHVSKWPSHLPRPTTNQFSLSAPQFQTSLRKKKPTSQDDLLQWGYTNPMSQRTPSSTQLWPGVEQDYVEQRNWENSLRKMCG